VLLKVIFAVVESLYRHIKTPIVEDTRKGKANVTIVVRGTSSAIVH